jgi:hypothetical protein
VEATGGDFDYGSPTVPDGALFVAADKSLLVFPSVRAAERYIQAVRVENGVYKSAYGPNGEPYRVESKRKRVIIEPTGDPNRPEELRTLLSSYLQNIGQPFEDNAPTPELVQQVWRWESDFWQENDPYGDRFSRPLPGWCCFSLLAIPAALLFLLVTKFREPLLGFLIAALVLWPVGVLAKRRADRTDFQTR